MAGDVPRNGDDLAPSTLRGFRAVRPRRFVLGAFDRPPSRENATAPDGAYATRCAADSRMRIKSVSRKRPFGKGG